MTTLSYRAAARNSTAQPLGIELVYDETVPPNEPGGEPHLVEKTARFLIDQPIAALPVIDHALLEVEGASDDVRWLSVGQLLKSLIRDEDWSRFRQVATEAKFDIDELTTIVRDVLRAAGRPTEPSSDSAGSPSASGTSSSDGTEQPAAADPFSAPLPD